MQKYDQIREGTFLQTLCGRINNHAKMQSNAESAYPLLATKHGGKVGYDGLWYVIRILFKSVYLSQFMKAADWSGAWLSSAHS